MVPVSQLPSAWDLSPLVLAAAFAVLVRFLQAFIRLRRRGRTDHAGWNRLVLFVAGLALIVLPLVSPLDTVGDEYLLSAHMLEHLLIGDAGPALLLVAVRGPLLAFMLPAPAMRPLNRFAPTHRVIGFCTRPSVCLGAWAAAIGLWHIPAAYDYTLTHPFVHELEHVSFVSVGLLVWMQLVDPARRRRLSVAQRLAFAGAVFLLGQLLGDLLLFAGSPVYPAYAHQHVRLFGISPLADQELAGLEMMGEQLLTLGLFSLLLLLSVLPPRPSARGDREPLGADARLVGEDRQRLVRG